MTQKAYHNPGKGYMGTTSNPPTPYTRKTTEDHKGSEKGKDIRTRNHCFAISPCKVTRADGTQYTIATTRNHNTSRKRTKQATQEARVVSEAQRFGEQQHSKLSIDEIRAINGL